VLFVVKLAETDELVTIPVPSFDLRYPLETIWHLGDPRDGPMLRPSWWLMVVENMWMFLWI
jgi:hypothetical protein